MLVLSEEIFCTIFTNKIRTAFSMMTAFPNGLCSIDDEGDDGGGGSGGDGDDGGGDQDGDDNDGDDKGGDGDDGGKPNKGLMSEGGDEDPEGEKDSGQTIEFKTDKTTETLNVPEKFWDKDGEKLNEGAVLKTALESGKAINKLQAELADAKKGIATDKSGVPEDVKEYLADSEGDDPFIKDGHLQLTDGGKNLKPVPIDDPVVQLFADVAKEEGIPKDQFNRIVSRVLAGVDENVPVMDLEAEAEKFGKNAKAVAGTNKAWADNMKEAGELSAAEHVHLMNMGQSAIGLSVVNKLRIATGGKSIPVNLDGVGGELPSKEEWYANKPDHRSDPVAYEKWQKQGEEIFGDEPAGSSQSGLGAPQSQGGSKSAYEGKEGKTRLHK
jgi:hypothetical protein